MPYIIYCFFDIDKQLCIIIKSFSFIFHCKYILQVFDKEQNGAINSAELRYLLTSLGDKLSDDEVEQLLNGHEDSQGNVNYESKEKS